MKRTAYPLCLLTALLLTACSGGSEDNNQPQCAAAAVCGEGQVEVSTCAEDTSCEEVSICGNTIYCADDVTCDGLPVCDITEEEVETCPDGSTSCREVSLCNATISCLPKEEPDSGCAEGSVYVNACEEWDESCTDYTGPGTPGKCKPFTPPAYALEGCDHMVSPGSGGAEAKTNLLTAFVEASPGDLICVVNGHYEIDEQLPLDSGVELRGETMEGVILDFASQQTGANGILAQPGPGEAVIFTQLTLKNTRGDAVRVEKADAVTFRHVTATWDGGPKEENGAYGLYPVQCKNVLIEHCKAYNASDAGIYVGQSSNILVHSSEAAYNVAGIEIENSSDAEVRDNNVHDNTGGVLVFNLPNLDVKTGARTKVHNNIIVNNNTKNFAPPQNIVAQVPAGSGVLLIAADDADIHDNTITGNQSLGVAVLSYQATQREDYLEDPDYDPYSTGNWIHDNTFDDNGSKPARQSLAEYIKTFSMVTRLEDMLWDGIFDDTTPLDERKNCWSANKRPDDSAATWRNFDALNLPSNENQTTELGDYDCTGTALPAITIP